MKYSTYKRWQALFALFSLFILLSSYYFQYVKGLQPCPLCLMQRICVFLLFALFFWGACVTSMRLGKVLTFFQLFFAAAGLFFASRQLWLQSLPSSETPSCMPELEVLIRYFPLRDILHSLFWGSGSCAEVSWQWLGLSMAAWTALYFLLQCCALVLFLALIYFSNPIKRNNGF